MHYSNNVYMSISKIMTQIDYHIR